MQDTKLIVSFKEAFGNKLWSEVEDFVINDEDLRISFRILNECIFESKLDNNVKFTIEEFKGQKSKGSFRAGYIADKQKYKQDIRFTRQPGEDNFFRIISVLAHEIVHHDGSACHDSPDIQPYLAVAEEVAYLTLYDGGIEQQEIDAGEETEERCGVFDEGRVEKFCRAVVCGEASCRECCHRIVYAVERRHAADVVAQSADKRENDVYHPDEVCAGREPRVHLRMYRSGCLG